MNWLMLVARAAPTTPHRKTATKRASSTMLETPAAMVMYSPNCGRSAVTRKLWKVFCSMKGTSAASTIRP